MGNDQLTRAQRVRLESLSQAVNMTVLISTEKPTLQGILGNAKSIEAFLKEARDDA